MTPDRVPIQRHPQLQKILEAYTTGQTARDIAKWVKPQLSHVTIWKYCKNVVQPAIAKAGTYARVLQDNQLGNAVGTPNPAGAHAVQLATEALVSAPIIQPYIARIRQHQQTIDSAIGFACDNEDPRSVAALIATDFKGIELDARMSGVSLDGPRQAAPDINLALIVQIPRYAPLPAAGPVVDLLPATEREER